MFEFVIAATTSPAATPSWAAFFGVIALASGVPSTLIVWLHVRLNALAEEHRTETQRLDAEFKKVRNEMSEEREMIFGELNNRFVTKETVTAQFKAVTEGIHGIHQRIGDVMAGITEIQRTNAKQGERIAHMEARKSSQ